LQSINPTAGRSPGKRRLMALAAATFALTSLLCASARAAAPIAQAPLDLAAYRGKVVYLDFWASWCGPCKLSFPYMERMASYYSHNKFVVIAVNVDHSRSSADAFINQLAVTIPVIFDPKGLIARKYNVTAMPTSVLIGKDGRIRYVHQGFFESQMLTYESHISDLLNEP
jgi:thiol-disulfide isomerase/thioredoxin